MASFAEHFPPFFARVDDVPAPVHPGPPNMYSFASPVKSYFKPYTAQKCSALSAIIYDEYEHTVTVMLYASGSMRTMLVDAPVLANGDASAVYGAGIKIRLDLRPWMSPSYTEGYRAHHLRGIKTLIVRRFPFDSATELPHAFAVVTFPQLLPEHAPPRRMQPANCFINALLQMTPKWHGNVAVAKLAYAGTSYTPVDVEKSDWNLIHRITMYVLQDAMLNEEGPVFQG